jgi:hypothetical protein
MLNALSMSVEVQSARPAFVVLVFLSLCGWLLGGKSPHDLCIARNLLTGHSPAVTIAKAIVKRSGRRDGAANVEDILDYVTKKWKNLRRKDGSQYSSASTYIRYARMPAALASLIFTRCTELTLLSSQPSSAS